MADYTMKIKHQNMKNNAISNLGKLAMVVAAMLLHFSCQQEESYGLPSGSTLLNLSVSAAGNGMAMANGNDASRIRSLCILQFNAKGPGFGTLRHVGIGAATTTNGQYSTTLFQSVDANDKYKLVVVANFPDDDYSIFQRMGGKTYADVQKACLSRVYTGEHNVPAFSSSDPFPMFGIVNDGEALLISEKRMTLNQVQLVRAVARVDIGVGVKNSLDNTWDKNGVKFDMTQIQIWKAGKQYAYMPAEANFTSSSGNLAINRPSVVGGDVEIKSYDSGSITNSTYCTEKIYLPEADLKWGDVYDAQHTSRLAIIVGGKYNGSSALSFYRMDFTAGNTRMDILRNNLYQFSITKVEGEGYSSAESAYNSRPKDIGFTAGVSKWVPEGKGEVSPVIGYRMSYGKLNGELTQWGDMTIPEKKDRWNDQTVTFDYNEFYGESNAKFAVTFPMGGRNGELYNTPDQAFTKEGAYPVLMVSGDDVSDETGRESYPWKTGQTLTAFDVCRNYQGEGYDDWRLPRLSELALIYLNQDKLIKMRGFIGLQGVYWSGSEYLEGDGHPTEQQLRHSGSAWGIDFAGGIPGNASHYLKTVSHKIRCVRQVAE